MECEYIGACPFFNDKMAKTPAIANSMKEKYCREDKMICARYAVRTAGKPVPIDLYPHEWGRVEPIVLATA